jgi:hypothetical protein
MASLIQVYSTDAPTKDSVVVDGNFVDYIIPYRGVDNTTAGIRFVVDLAAIWLVNSKVKTGSWNPL